ncbi:MAG: hypothetical protein ABJA66_22020, partial [Actinomycetota bacterium]
MFKSKLKFNWLILISLFSTLFLTPAFSQMMPATAQLKVTGKSSFIVINGENSTNETKLVSPARISVPAGTKAIIKLNKAGIIELFEGTATNITFTETTVTVDLSEGRMRINSFPNTDFNIKTDDGIIINDKSQDAIFETEIVGGATGVNTDVGLVKVNGVPLKAGEFWTADPKLKSKFEAIKNKKTNKRSSYSLLKVALFGAVGAGAVTVIV